MRINHLALVLSLIAVAPDAARAQWTALGLEGEVIKQLQHHDGELFAATHSGLYARRLDASGWTHLGPDDHRINAFARLSSDTLVVAADTFAEDSPATTFYRSVDGGNTWAQIAHHFSEDAPYESILTLSPVPHRPGRILAGGGASVSISDDAGETWREVWGGWDHHGMGVHFFTLDPQDPDRIWSGGEMAIFWPYVLESMDAGEEWRFIPLDLGGDNAVYSAVVDPEDSDVVLLGTEAFIVKTTDGGETWRTVFEADHGAYVYGMHVSPTVDRRVYAAAWRRIDSQDLIVYVSDDMGETWERVERGLDGQFGVVATDLAVVDGRDVLFLATTEEGVYRFTAPTAVGVSPVPRLPGETPLLMQSYPNPVRGETTVDFVLPAATNVRLAIYDLLGREVAVLVNAHLGAGSHRVTVDAGPLAAGVYLYRLEAGSFAAARRFVVME